MTAMEVLERCRSAQEDIRLLEARLTRYRESAERITSTIGGTGSRGTGEPDRMAAIVAEVDAIEHAIARRKVDYAAEAAAACRLMDGLSEMECKVLDGYYIDGKSLALLAREMTYSYGYVRAVKATAVKRILSIDDAVVTRCLPKWYRERYGIV